jgi:DNA-binding NarL/FixJ family response regulator
VDGSVHSGLYNSRGYTDKKSIKKGCVYRLSKAPLLNHDQLAKAGITSREGEILVLIDEGFTNQQIADKLFIAESTVKRHTSRVCKKLHVKRPAESVRKAKEMSILL